MPPAPFIALCVSVACLLAGPAHAATMFDEGRAERAFAAIATAVGHPMRVGDVHITPDELSVTIANDDKPGQAETWEVSQKSVAGALRVESAKLVYTGDAQFPNRIKDAVYDLDAANLKIVPKLAADALARARLQTPGSVTEMELQRLPKIFSSTAADPIWQIHVKAAEEFADFGAKMSGEITSADLNHTNRAQDLDLLAGGPDFDEMIQDIRTQIKNDWIFHYIEIEKSQINFDVHLLTVKNARITRFTATLAGVRTDNMSMPHQVFPGTPVDDPFNLADVDFGVMTKLVQAAKGRLGIADGVVQRIVISKPHREKGGTIEWEVEVRSASAPLFWMPGQPPVQEGAFAFDTKGEFLHAKYPPGHGPQTHLLEPSDLQKAVGKISERLGPHAQLSELRISDQSVSFTAADPHNPTTLAAFEYKDNDVVRVAEPFQEMARAMGGTPDWRWDLSVITPATVQMIGALEKRALDTLKIDGGAVDGVVISKDKAFHSTNNQVLIEISVKGEGDAHDSVTYDLSGASPKLAPAQSGLFVNGKPVQTQTSDVDEQDCTRASDPQVVIPACTRMIEESQADTPHDRAMLYYDRGIAYKNEKQLDRALADYSEAIKLDPRYSHAYLNRALAYASTGDFAGSIADSSEAIKLDPTNMLPYLNRGLAYRSLRNFDAAIADFTKAVSISSAGPNLFLTRGYAYCSKGDMNSAIADYGETLKRDPRSAAAYNNRGLAFAHKGDFDRANADLTQAIQIDPKYAGAYFSRGVDDYLMSQLPKALADLT